MRKVMVEKHGQDVPNTYIDRSTTVDRIWAIGGITPHKCRYLGFGDGIGGNHELL